MWQDLERSGVLANVVVRFERFSLTSLTAFRKTDAYVTIDLDFTDLDWVSDAPAGDTSEAISQELQFTSVGAARSQWVAGVFFLRDEASQFHNQNLPLLEVFHNPSADNTTNAWAVFGQGSRYFTKKLRGTAGLRYSYEKKHHVLVDRYNGVVVGTSDDTDSWDSLSPKLGVEYLSSDHAMLFASITHGFKSGGFNSTQIQGPFDPEYVWSYEVGAKTSVIKERLHANFYVFFYDFSDMQLNVYSSDPGAISTVVNAGKARISGIEAEFITRSFKRWDFSVGLAYLHARFEEFVSADPNDLGADPDQSGNPLPRAPDFSASASVAYTWPMKGAGNLTLHGGYRFQSRVFFTPFEDFYASQGSYSLWDANLRYDNPTQEWYIALYGTNLGNQLYAHWGGRDQLRGLNYGWGAPRTIGFMGGVRY
jgi:iron complex outermembrane receptor protein